ncbi:tyrosine-type recombinase/integrase [Symbiobacterium terraclitae]|uniref:tyrosine-type recombinase/integrase n=1 Tax=Symbiobacterium terraclitae TaxID=557451 RepID=UPI0035B55EAE
MASGKITGVPVDARPYRRSSDGLWVITLELGRDPVTGRRRRKTFAAKTRAGAKKKLADYLEATRQGYTNPTNETLAEFLERWLRDVAAHAVRPVTLQSYRWQLAPIMNGWLGKIRLTDLQPAAIQQFYSARLEEGRSRRTVQYTHAVLRKALGQAVRWGIIPRNPTDAVDAPKPARKDMRVLAREQIQALMGVLEGDALGPLYLLALYTGCRRGELVALRWQDVDLDNALIRITRTAQLVDYEVRWSEPKTARSRRVIALPDAAVEMLRRHRKRQLEERIAKGGDYEDQGLVFAQSDGRPWNPSHVTQHWAVVLERAGLPHVRLHDLRHTHATLLLEAGVHPKVVSERLGHSTTTLTLDVYSHVMPSMQREAAAAIDDALSRPNCSQTVARDQGRRKQMKSDSG